MMPDRGRPQPAPGQWWRLMAHEGVITKILPGGAGNLGIAVFEGDVPPAHASTMLRFDAWAYLPNGPTKRALEAPCTCVTLEGGITIADGCARHDAKGAKAAEVVEPRRMTG